MTSQAIKDKWREIDIDKLKANDSNQLSKLYNLLLPRIRFFATSYLRSTAIPDYNAEDIAHDVLLSIFSSLHKYEPTNATDTSFSKIVEQPEYERFQSWCYRVAINLIKSKTFNLIKSKSLFSHREQPRGLDKDELAAPIIDPERMYESVRLIDEILLQLTPTERELFLMAFQEGLSSIEIAEALNVTASTVRHRLSRIRMKLQKGLKLASGGTLDVATEQKEVTS